MRPAPEREATYEDLLALPPHQIGQIIAGELIASPSTAGLDRVRKKHIYAREGVEYVWLVDPVGRTLEVFQLRDGQWLEVGAWSGEDSIRAAPFDAIELELGALWIPEAPTP